MSCIFFFISDFFIALFYFIKKCWLHVFSHLKTAAPC